MAKVLSEDERELVSIVGDDLAFLQEEWDQDVTDDSIRRSSVVLRRLLVDKHLGQAWRYVGFEKEPVVAAADLASVIEGIPPESVTFAQAGGALHRGLEIDVGLHLEFALSPQQAQILSHRMKAARKEFTLSRFMSSLAIVVGGTPISREEVVLYVTNKLGGAHFDPSRKENAKEAKYKQLDFCRANIKTSATNGVLFELLSIGQVLLRSRDIARLMYVVKGGPLPK